MKPFAALFPGQGSQYAGMGKALHDTFAVARAVFDAADAALGESLSRVCFEGPEEALAKTENTQPAILTVAVAAARVLESRGAKPMAAAGHSLGEYGALVAAGTVRFEDAVRIVRRRGRFMQEAVPLGRGAMAAVLGLDRASLEEVCRVAAGDEIVSAANFNGPGQIVIAGHAGAVERASRLASEAGAKRVVLLPVSAPFHCELMRPAAQRLVPVLDDVTFRDPAIPVYTNVDAAPIATAAAAKDALARQVVAPVRWEEEIAAMADAGVGTFVEIGPGTVLSGLVRRIRRDATVLQVSDPATLERTLGALEVAA